MQCWRHTVSISPSWRYRVTMRFQNRNHKLEMRLRVQDPTISTGKILNLKCKRLQDFKKVYLVHFWYFMGQGIQIRKNLTYLVGWCATNHKWKKKTMQQLANSRWASPIVIWIFREFVMKKEKLKASIKTDMYRDWHAVHSWRIHTKCLAEVIEPIIAL